MRKIEKDLKKEITSITPDIYKKVSEQKIIKDVADSDKIFTQDVEYTKKRKRSTGLRLAYSFGAMAAVVLLLIVFINNKNSKVAMKNPETGDVAVAEQLARDTEDTKTLISVVDENKNSYVIVTPLPDVIVTPLPDVIVTSLPENGIANNQIVEPDYIRYTKREAIELARETAGGGDVMEYSYDDNKHEVTLRIGDDKYEYEINDITGEIRLDEVDKNEYKYDAVFEVTPTPAPTVTVSVDPTKAPQSVSPTAVPTKAPQSASPTVVPTKAPQSVSPTAAPTKTEQSISPIAEPTMIPTVTGKYTRDEAVALAIQTAGGGTLVEYSFDDNHHEVSLRIGDDKYEYEINNTTGQIRLDEIDRNEYSQGKSDDYDDDWDDDRDDWDDDRDDWDDDRDDWDDDRDDIDDWEDIDDRYDDWDD